MQRRSSTFHRLELFGEGAHDTSQRVAAAESSARSHHGRARKHGVSLASLASCKRRVDARSKREPSTITPATLPLRRARSALQSRSPGRSARTKRELAALIAPRLDIMVGRYGQTRAPTQTRRPSRSGAVARAWRAMASRTPNAGAQGPDRPPSSGVPIHSCTPSRRSPPPGSTASMGPTPVGTTRAARPSHATPSPSQRRKRASAWAQRPSFAGLTEASSGSVTESTLLGY